MWYNIGFDEPTTDNSEVNNFLEMVCPLHRNWEEFRFECLSEDVNTDHLKEFVDLIVSHLRFTDMPSLSSITLGLPDPAKEIFMIEEKTRPLPWSKWNMPNIWNVFLWGTYMTISFGSSLTSLTVDYDDEDQNIVPAVHTLLQNNPGVKELDLSICDHSVLGSFVPDPLPKLKPERLESFSIRATADHASSLLALLIVPVISKLKITACIPKGIFIRPNYLDKVIENNDYNLLESFSLIIRTECLLNYRVGAPDLIGPALSKFKKLRHLHLSIPNTLPPSISQTDSSLQSLRTLRLENSDLLDTGFLNDLKRKQEIMGVFDKFEMLEIKSCAKLSEELVHRLFPAGKVAFIEVPDKCMYPVGLLFWRCLIIFFEVNGGPGVVIESTSLTHK